MLSIEDIKKLTEFQKEIFATKEDLATEIKTVRDDIRRLTQTVESFAKRTTDSENEIKIVNQRVTTTEDWIKQAAPKLDIEYRP